MKKLLLSVLALACAANFSYAQNTNPWPPSGNVGIGTSSPGTLLDVEGGTLRIGNGSGSYTGFYFNSGTGLTQENNNKVTLNGALQVNSTAGASSYIASGNVGIGTTSPITKMDVRGSIIAGTTDLAIGSIGSFLQIQQGAGTGNTFSSIGAYSNGGNNWNNLIFQSGGGNVLIGQTTQANSAYKLDVWGSARASKMVVNATGADFVFEPTYKLPALSDIERYIRQNHHLSEIPSAAEMQKDGMDVGELNTKLLQKVEELTLYLIEKDKDNAAQKKINQTQQGEINQLKASLEILRKEINNRHKL